MSRKFVDLWVRLEPGGEEIVKALARLGFSAAVAEFHGSEEEWKSLKDLAQEEGLELYRKLILKPHGRNELLRALRVNRGRYEVITVMCKNLETALVAARDGRVDTLIIPPSPGYRIDKGVAALLKNRVEIPFKEFLDPYARERFLRTALKVIGVLGRKAGVIASSGASTTLELRGPRQLAALLMVLGLDQERALDSVSAEPCSILEENLVKLSPNYVARGVVKIG